MEHQIKVVGGHIVVLVRQAVGICKMRPCGTDPGCFLVHHFNKSFDRSAHMNCDRVCRVVSRRDQKTIKKLLQCQLISGNNPRHGGTALRDYRLLRNRHHIFKISIFQGDKRRHDLRRAGRISAFKNILRKYGISTIERKYPGRLRCECSVSVDPIRYHRQVCRKAVRRSSAA